MSIPLPIAIADTPSARFESIVLSEEFHSEGAAVADINGDGNRDILSGPFWYAGPEFRHRHAYAPVKSYSIKGYSDHFFTFARDFNRDGRVDILSIPIPGGAAVWYENPAAINVAWKCHLAFDGVDNESPTMADIDGDGVDEIVCIHDGQYGYATPQEEPTKPWKFMAVSEKRGYGRFTHGLGVGDVDGDGRADLLEKDGWWQQTESPDALFKFHPVKFAESGGSQMFVDDFDGDGDNDVVSVQNAHAYGLCWFERRGDDPNDFLFVKHPILTARAEENPYGLAISQMHALALADVDGDGIRDLVTGKRFYAHGGGDPGSAELPVLYWFRTTRHSAGVDFIPHLIDVRVGVGTQLTVNDVDGNGHVDIIIGNKLGTFLAMNSGQSQRVPDRISNPRHTIGTNEFKNGVRTTEALTPQQEKETFVLPAGFEAQLVASEPDIAKPMNMAFDNRGRIWVTSSVEYPYAAEQGKGRDRISILEDTNGDGSANKVITFADDLNIPIGLYPYGDGVICYSIPNILYLRDTDGDNKADKREILYGPFDASRDTHGMCNGFTRGNDGWLYACHGFNNQSSVSGRDGNQVTMHSGNTFRIRLDGSRIEQFTHGQVNPFGMALDPRGDLFTADCHTKPVTLLIKGGYYESFGKPHDGLGFVPNVMQHLHGSTAIGGIALYHGQQFPYVYHGNAFGGNVMTSRVNRNSIRRVGSSVVAQEEADFLISGDPWFRPVDLQIGPDGALYIADFYNRIIGHYEVPLTHPGRDRDRGRIWRIVYKPTDQRRDSGSQSQTAVEKPAEDIESTIKLLASRNLTRRMLATDKLVDEFGQDAAESLQEAVSGSADSNTRIHGRWALHRLGQLSKEALSVGLRDADAQARSHAFQILADMNVDPESAASLTQDGLGDQDPHVRRSAVMASLAHPSQSLIPPLLTLLDSTPANDVHLRHVIRMSLRDHLSHRDWFAATTASNDEEVAAHVIDLCLAIKTDFAGEFVASHLSLLSGSDRGDLIQYLTFAARYAALDHLPAIAALAEDRFGDDKALQEQLLRAIHTGLQQRGSDIPPVIRGWAKRLVRTYLGMNESDRQLPKLAPTINWTYRPHPSTPDHGNPWTISTKRDSADGQRSSILHSSFPKGERMTGIYRSELFEMPGEFSFYLAGHDGFPDKPINHKNLVRIRDAASHAVLKSWSPPRNDTAQRMKWKADDAAGRDVYVELVDGDTAGAFAWLAVGRFSVAGLNPTRVTGDRRLAAALITDLKLESFRAIAKQLISDPKSSRQSVNEFAKALAALNSSSQSSALAESLTIAGITPKMRRQMITLLLDGESDKLEQALGTAMKAATAVEQRRLGQVLTTDHRGLSILLALIEAGHASARILTDPTTAARVGSLASDAEKDRIGRMLKDLPNEDDSLVKTMQQQKRSYLAKSGNASVGAETFRVQCGVCHQVAGKGTAVGPNLDGIGNRGLDRVIEDVMIPNRNIDAAFKASVVLTDDGQVVSGLVKRTEGAQLVIVDQKGKEITIPTDTIDEQKVVGTSPMPANFQESFDDQKLRDLLAYLLSLTH